MSNHGAPPTDAATPSFSPGKVAGDLEALTIFDLTQMMMHSQKSGLLTIECDGRKGYVYFDKGQIVSVTDDSLFQGSAAAFRVFLWQGGRFELDLSKKTSERNIRMSTENLMLDIARRVDEASQGCDAGAEASPSLTWDNPDGASEEESIEKVQKERLRQINSTFNKIAENVLGQEGTPAVGQVDLLLARMREYGGNAIFLMPGAHPRIRIDGILHEVSELGPMTEPALEQLVADLVPEAVRRGLDRKHEVHYRADRDGDHPHKIVVNVETGGMVVSLHALPSALEVARGAEIPARVLETIARPGGGIVLLAGGPEATLEALLAGVVATAATESGRLASLLLHHLEFALGSGRGLVIVRKVRSRAGHMVRALRRTLHLDPQVVGIASLEDPHVAVEVIRQARKGVSFVCGVTGGTDVEASMGQIYRSERTLREACPGSEPLLRYVRGLIQFAPGEPGQAPLRVSKILSGTTLSERAPTS